jgi:signal transduction histidine kinase
MPINHILKRIESTFTGAAREKGLSFRVVTSSAWVRSDVILLERIILNLASNAVRYTSSGGVVVGCRHRGNLIRIEVCDSGSGIPEDQRRNIFGEFYRLAGENRQGGLGLGLAIVERLCKLLDHPIELTSTVGKGSRFAVKVPLAPAQAQFYCRRRRGRRVERQIRCGDRRRCPCARQRGRDVAQLGLPGPDRGLA